MYNSPIKILYGSTQRGIEDEVFKAILSYGIQVDKDELIRALAYDRDQYNRGFNDGIMAAADELVRCKDCKHYEIHRPKVLENCERNGHLIPVSPDGFCCFGERRSDD